MEKLIEFINEIGIPLQSSKQLGSHKLLSFGKKEEKPSRFDIKPSYEPHRLGRSGSLDT